MPRQALGDVRKVAEGDVAPRAHRVSVLAPPPKIYFPIENVDGQPVLRVMEAEATLTKSPYTASWRHFNEMKNLNDDNHNRSTIGYQHAERGGNVCEL